MSRSKRPVKVVENVCLTCTKRYSVQRDKHGGCYALTERIGKYGECFAWSNDKEWFIKMHDAVENYRSMKKNTGYIL